MWHSRLWLIPVALIIWGVSEGDTSLNHLPRPARKICNGAEVVNWINPNGSSGGWVAKTANVNKEVFIGPEAEVCGQAVVTGKTRIFGRAEINGKSKIHNSTICQASLINGFDVKDSDYYCQTEDPEPPYPGEEGMKTLLGVDTDGDGVRDDLEIWINDAFSNTPDKDRRIIRQEFKKYSKKLNQIMANSKNKEKVIEIYTSAEPSIDCLFSLEDFEVLSTKLKFHEALLMNTIERGRVYMAAQNHMAGRGYLIEEKGKASCSFK